MFPRKSTFLKGICLGAGVLACALFVLFEDDSEILIESRESKTIDGKPVFNRIKKITSKLGDAWIMNQSHHGVKAAPELWERLVLKVTGSDKPTAEFMQLQAGELNLTNADQPTNLRVACFMCHPNGPRAIRPNYDSTEAPIELKNRLRIAIWNLQIKIAGRIRLSEKSSVGSIPVRYPGTLANEKLNVETCQHCHKENGFLARGALQRQHFMAIRFMVDSGSMPPPGFSLDQQEAKAIRTFLGEE